MIRERGWSYLESEKEFVKYFNRLHDIGMDFDEIETKILPQIKEYYFDMVVKGRHYPSAIMPTHVELFNNWKNSIIHPF